ncbi:unnamed protein product [Nesidiocoris tenuis]|uniref:Uncharacterized protein n=1 Tax=Nesidiocoris tenuis TaxID=355587 RepID=A0A6H5HK60_9HEMI|nr:unnamed protein product [Nesidiocoris tenuis]
MSDQPLELRRFAWFATYCLLIALTSEGLGVLIGFTFNCTVNTLYRLLQVGTLELLIPHYSMLFTERDSRWAVFNGANSHVGDARHGIRGSDSSGHASATQSFLPEIRHSRHHNGSLSRQAPYFGNKFFKCSSIRCLYCMSSPNMGTTKQCGSTNVDDYGHIGRRAHVTSILFLVFCGYYSIYCRYLGQQTYNFFYRLTRFSIEFVEIS